MRQSDWRTLNDIIYLVIGVIEIVKKRKKRPIGINWKNILVIMLILELLPVCLVVSRLSIGQILNIIPRAE